MSASGGPERTAATGRAGTAGTAAPAPPRVSAVLVNWNGVGWLPGIVGSLRAQRDVELELVVSDNASTDGSVEWLEREAPEARLVRNASNLGFAGGVNRGLAAAAAPYVLLINPDVELEPDYCALLAAALAADHRAGSASGRLLRDRRPGAPIDSTGHVVFTCGWAGNRDEDTPDRDGGGGGVEEVFGVSAAAAMYRRAALEDVAAPDGVLPEPFFAYIEDVDLDWRLRWRGWRALYVERAVAVHRRSGTGARFTPRIRRHILKNRLLLVAREWDSGWLLRDAGAIALLTVLKTADFALSSPSAVLGIVDAAREMPAALRARRAIMASRTASAGELRRWMRPFPWIAKPLDRLARRPLDRSPRR